MFSKAKGRQPEELGTPKRSPLKPRAICLTERVPGPLGSADNGDEAPSLLLTTRAAAKGFFHYGSHECILGERGPWR